MTPLFIIDGIKRYAGERWSCGFSPLPVRGLSLSLSHMRSSKQCSRSCRSVTTTVPTDTRWWRLPGKTFREKPGCFCFPRSSRVTATLNYYGAPKGELWGKHGIGIVKKYISPGILGRRRTHHRCLSREQMSKK